MHMHAGLNVVLISRTAAKLDAAAEEIRTKYKVKTKVLAVDFAKADADTYARLKAEVAPLEVRWLGVAIYQHCMHALALASWAL